MKNLALVLVLLVAVGLVAAVLFFDDGGSPAVVPTVDTREPEPAAPEPEPVDLVDTVPEPSAAPASAAEVVPPSEVSQRAAVDDRLDGRTWADLLFPVSSEDGAPIEGARIIHIDHKGERRVVSLDDPILEDDLHERALAAIDTDAHCYRAFLPRDLAEHSGDPIHVSLHPSARVRFVLLGDEPEVWPEFQIAVSSDWDAFSEEGALGFEDADLEDADLEDADFEAFERIQPLLAFGPNLRFILSESSDAKYRRRQVRWAARTEEVRPLLELSGAPLVLGHAAVTLSGVSSLPLVVDDLPDAVQVDVYQDFDEEPALVELFGPDDASLDWLDDTTYTTDREEDLVVRVAFPPPATVIGTIGPGHEGGAVTVSALDEMGDPSWFETWEVEFAEDGGFSVGGLPPGGFDLAATWSAAGGARFQAQRRFELEPGQVLDLGRIDASTGGSFTFRPVVIVDGVEDPTLLDGALDGLEWELSISQTKSLDISVFENLEEWQFEDEAFMDELLASQGAGESVNHEAEIVGFAETTFGSVEPGRYWVSTFYWEVPEEVANGYRVVGFQPTEEIDVSGDAVHEIPFVLESAAMLRIVAEVPALGPGYDQWIELVAWNDAGEVRRFEDFEDIYRSSSDEPWKIDGAVALDPGVWEFVVLVTCELDTWLFDDEEELPDLPPRSFVSRSTVTIATVDARDTLRAQLQPGATLRGTEKAFRGDDDGWGWIQLHPVGAPAELGDVWFTYAEDESETGVAAPLVVRALLPNTEYAMDGAARTVTTGGAGSVVDLIE